MASMARILAIEKSTKGSVSISLDWVPALNVTREVALSRNFKVGSTLSPEQVLDLIKADDTHRAHLVALRFLGQRPRSEKEVRDRLRRERFPIDIVDREVVRLKDVALVNDASFARFWKEGREASRPRSLRVMKMELRRKGVDGEAIDDVLADVDEEDGAYRAASKRVHTLAGLDEQAFSRRLGQFLQRRGYRYDLARRVVERLWRESREKSEDSTGHRDEL
jgi:regulatory protein